MCATEPDERSPPDGAADGPLDASPPNSDIADAVEEAAQRFAARSSRTTTTSAASRPTARTARAPRARGEPLHEAGDGRPSGIAADELARARGYGAETGGGAPGGGCGFSSSADERRAAR